MGIRAWAGVLAAAAILSAAEPSARALQRRAERAEKAGQTAEAIRLYTLAASKGSESAAGRARSLTGQMALLAAQAGPAPEAPARQDEATADEFPAITPDDLREARELLPPPELTLTGGPFTVDWSDTAPRLWEMAARALGLELTLDGEYPPGGPRLRFRGEEQSAKELLRSLSVATGSFLSVQGPRRILVAKDTAVKRRDLEPVVAVVLTLPHPISPQELQEAARAVQQTMEIQKFAIDNARHMVLLRDRVSKIRPAQHLFEQLLGARPAVVVELELVELRQIGSRQTGIGLPTSAKFLWLGNLLNNNPGDAGAGAALATFGGGKTLMGMTIADATVTATAMRSFGSTLQRTFVQAIHGQPAQLILGEKYPILTGAFSGGGASQPGTGFALAPSFQFENLGLTLKVTPAVHGEEEMTLEVEAEFKLLTGAQINGIPVLANRKFTSRVRMRNGEWALLGGLARQSVSSNTSGIPGLSQLPVLGPLLRKTTNESEDAEFLVVLKPRLLGMGTDLTPPILFLGPEGRPAMPL